MEDLQNILASREDFYSKAQFRLDTSRQSLDDTFSSLKDLAREELLAGAGS
jgi:XRE family aerobic/anaerobic benzoate catabolism transcriptional regulator